MKRVNIVISVVGVFLITACVSQKKYNQVAKDLEDSKTRMAAIEKALEETKGQASTVEKALAETQQTLTKEQEARKALEEKTQTYKDLETSLKKEIADGQIKLSEMKDRLTVNMVDKVLFSSGSAVLKATGKESLKKVAAVLKDVKGKLIQVGGHTDNVGIGGALAQKFPTNWELSTARATAVVRDLGALGVPETMMSTTGFSMFSPIAPNDTEAGRQQNRRIEIVLIPDLRIIAEATPSSPQ